MRECDGHAAGAGRDIVDDRRRNIRDEVERGADTQLRLRTGDKGALIAQYRERPELGFADKMLEWLASAPAGDELGELRSGQGRERPRIAVE